MSRKNIGNKLRFEVLKRDKFVCQYCGKGPPKIEINVDHIDPVANGGSNEIDNLITSCFECNSGKGKNEVIGKKKKRTTLNDVARVLYAHGICRESDCGFDVCFSYIMSAITKLIGAHGHSCAEYQSDEDLDHGKELFICETVDAIAELLAICHGVEADIDGMLIEKIKGIQERAQ